MAASVTDYSPRSSIEFDKPQLKESEAAADSSVTLPNSQSPSNALSELPPATIRLLFSLLERRHVFCLMLPAMLSSIVAGGVAPFMTFVIGQSFNAFAAFSVSKGTPADQAALSAGVGLACLELVGLAFGALALSATTSALWIWVGERNVRAVRNVVYKSVVGKDMTWFDTCMGAENPTGVEESDGPLGAGGLMAKFSRETDEVRTASSLASGYLLQYMTSTIAALALALARAPTLTLVILSAVPLLTFIQTMSQVFASPPLAAERLHNARAATLVDRMASAIATVKAFNAAPAEALRLEKVFDLIASAAIKCNKVWGVTSASSQFVMMAMFVQGFWFGAHLVRNGTNTPGDVMAVFWACLIATSNLQMCIPQLMVITKGKFAMSALLSVASTQSSSSIQTNLGITPSRCAGELALHDVSFSYPARPDSKILDGVSLYLPSGEMTFVVGGSGSGKSTLAELLMRNYPPTTGTIALDDQDIQFLAPRFVKQHIAGVAQSCVLFDASVLENVAMGAINGESLPRKAIEDACRSALMHEFVRDLPMGYDTALGTNGASLSGGQKQRLAIARAKIRDPTVLILDEATSALDPTSRLLVFEAIKQFRQNKTTIVITHDLSQINAEDFVYVLRTGKVVEQGFRRDLELEAGEFRGMMMSQNNTGGCLPAKDPEAPVVHDCPVSQLLVQSEDDIIEERRRTQRLTGTFGPWMLEAVNELTKPVEKPARTQTVRVKPQSRPRPLDLATDDDASEGRRTASLDLPSPATTIAVPPPSYRRSVQRQSLQFSPTSPTSPRRFFEAPGDIYTCEDKRAMERSAQRAAARRPSAGTLRLPVPEAAPVEVVVPPADAPEEAQLGFWALMCKIYPTYPRKPLLLLGMVVAVLSGAMTPVFSYLLSKLMYEVSIGATDNRMINIYGSVVLATAALDGILMGLKFIILEISAMRWVTRIRNICVGKILAQDKAWFDDSGHSPVRLMQVLVKDGEDARDLISTVVGQSLVVSTMLGVGLLWALIQGWQLTLVGFAVAPVFAVSMSIQANLVAKCQLRNKRAREEVAKGYYEAISNIRAIRAMSFERIFQRQFDKAADSALDSGVAGAFVEGGTLGVSTALIYLAEALLFFVGARLIANGTYTYLQMVQVLNLVVFSVSIGSQLMAFTERIAKSVQATRDFNELLQLDTQSMEAQGSLLPVISGDVVFKNVSFSYPERADVPVLKRMSLRLADGECVAIVGASGSGKSTIAALLQRLYEPTSGSIFIDGHAIHNTDVHHLRSHVSVVSQNPNLFDATISENIRYGNTTLTDSDIRRAARAAHVHDFIMTLPSGYDTVVGENAALISGGQAQRIQIARALARPARILILDECTSALDPENQAAVLETIQAAKVGRTTMMVTHKLAVMQMCDRIIVVNDGRVAEEGTYDDLMGRKGVFADLASGGEWFGE